MSRVIKFRSWTPESDEDGIVIPGRMNYQLMHQALRAVRTETREVPEALMFDHVTSGIYELNEQLASHGDRLMQFTGLLDKNGKEIYEGDVVRCGRSITVVEWENEINQDFYWGNAAGFVFNFNPNEMGETRDFEVIGNIYETPNLLDHA